MKDIFIGNARQKKINEIENKSCLSWLNTLGQIIHRERRKLMYHLSGIRPLKWGSLPQSTTTQVR